jgi:hypothetical protein
MKNYLAIAFVLGIVLMFLSGCAKAPIETQEEPVEEQEPVKTTKKVTQPVEEEPVVEEEVAPARVPSKSIQELLQKHVGRIVSLRYMYQDATIKPEEWETWVKDNKMHVKLREMDNVRGDVYVDNIYLDLGTKKAVGYCERNVYRCADPNTPIDVSFGKYYRKPPIDWIEEVTYAEKETEETMQQRTVWKIFFTEGDKTTAMFVDTYYGVPVKVIEKSGGVTSDFIYEDIAFNTVDDVDLDHGFIQKAYN